MTPTLERLEKERNAEMSERPTIKIGPQTANTVEIYIGEVRIVASDTDIRIEANGQNIEVIP